MYTGNYKELIIDTAGIKVVGVFRSEESAKKVLTRLGNPSEDKFVPIIGNVGEYFLFYKLHLRFTE